MSKSPNLFNFLISFKALRFLFQRREPFFSTYLHCHLLVLTTVTGNYHYQCSFLVIPISFSLSFLSVYSQLSLSFPSVYSQHIRFRMLSMFQLLPSAYGSPLFPTRSSFYLDLLVFLVFLLLSACISILSAGIFSVTRSLPWQPMFFCVQVCSSSTGVACQFLCEIFSQQVI